MTAADTAPPAEQYDAGQLASLVRVMRQEDDAQ